jgi:hypothetical protein
MDGLRRHPRGGKGRWPSARRRGPAPTASCRRPVGWPVSLAVRPATPASADDPGRPGRYTEGLPGARPTVRPRHAARSHLPRTRRTRAQDPLNLLCVEPRFTGRLGGGRLAGASPRLPPRVLLPPGRWPRDPAWDEARQLAAFVPSPTRRSRSTPPNRSARPPAPPDQATCRTPGRQGRLVPLGRRRAVQVEHAGGPPAAPPCPLGPEEAEDDEDMAVDVPPDGRTRFGSWWTPAPWVCGPYRGVGVSSRARVSRPASVAGGGTAARASRVAMRSAFFPADATVASQGRNGSLSLAARTQLVTARRPRARAAPRNSRASRGADRRSSTAARRENHWLEAGGRCADDRAGSDRVRRRVG